MSGNQHPVLNNFCDVTSGVRVSNYRIETVY